MLPIRLCHVSLTHPQTPKNRRLPNAFKKKRPSHLEHKQHQRRFKSTEALLESSPEASRNFKNFDLKCKEHSKQNYLNYLPRSQRSLESSSKTSTNHKSVKLNGFKPLKPRRTSTTNLRR